MKHRIRNIFEKLEDSVEIILIKNSSEPLIDENFYYVTNLDKGIFEGSIAILYPDKKPDLIISDLESEIAQKSDSTLNIYSNINDFQQIFYKLLSGYQKIGLNFQRLSYLDYINLKQKLPQTEFIDVSEPINNSRMIKDAQEIETIKKACSIADNVMGKIPDLLNENITEDEIAAEIVYALYKNHADNPAFETISSFGENTSKPHYSHGDVKIKNGDLCLFDFGARFMRYNSDMTRTFVFGSKNKTQADMYETVKEAQSFAFDQIRADVNANDIHNQVQTFIDNTQFKGRFIHSTGHSLGLSVHDPGIRLSPDSDTELKENMILTVEPGVYIPGFGGVRIEDDVLVTKNGIEILTKSSREFIEI